MGLTMYWTTLLVLVRIVALVAGKGKISSFFTHASVRTKDEKGDVLPPLLFGHHHHANDDSISNDEDEHSDPITKQQQRKPDQASHLLLPIFLAPYLLATASEYLQSPFLYPFLHTSNTVHAQVSLPRALTLILILTTTLDMDPKPQPSYPSPQK
ncbi:hypothetical protein F5Y17DRAFT_459348 [Xylariaceae sp. FL0594]|nr:hypothetical protein F5Y17DRAFT_459348 [Xylariaceae sp. FL0594]